MGALLKLIPLPVLLSVVLGGAALFGFKGWWNAHQDKQELQNEIATLERSFEAREAANAKRLEDHSRISERGMADVKALSQVPITDCFDTPLPDAVQRLLSTPQSD